MDQFFGAKILGGDGPQMPAPPPMTSTQVILRSTTSKISAIIDGEGTVVAYQLNLVDQINLTTYAYRFGDEVREEWKEIINALPAVGEKIPVEEEETPHDE